MTALHNYSYIVVDTQRGCHTLKLWFSFFFKLQYFIQAMKFRWPTEKLLWPSIYPSISCGVSEMWCGSFEGHMTFFENNSYTVGNFLRIYTAVEIYIIFDIYKHYHWNTELQFVSMSIPYAWFQFTWRAVRGVDSKSRMVYRVCMTYR